MITPDEAISRIESELRRLRAEQSIMLLTASQELIWIDEKTCELRFRVEYRCGHHFIQTDFHPTKDYLCPTCSMPAPTIILNA